MLMGAFRSCAVTYIINLLTCACQDLRLDFHVYIPLRKGVFSFLYLLSSHFFSCVAAVEHVV